jgi:hypothetical protein
MRITKKTEFNVRDDFNYVKSIAIESSRLAKCVRHARANKIPGVFGYSDFGFFENDLEFLSELEFVEAVWFWGVSLKSIDTLYRLNNLKHFGIHPKRPEINFACFPLLENVVIEPRAGDSSLAGLTHLRTLGVWRYRPASNSLEGLEIPTSIEELRIAWSSLKSVDSLPTLKNLKQLKIERCRDFEDLSSLRRIAPNLEQLWVGACGRMKTEQATKAVEGMAGLKFAVNGRDVIVGAQSAT